MIVYSFNQSRSALPQVTFKWQGFTTQWYTSGTGSPASTLAFFLSIKLALLGTVIAADPGHTPRARAGALPFRGKGATEQVMFTNIAAPEIVLGASLLGFFITLNLDRGFSTLLIAHVMFCIAYVDDHRAGRLSGFDPMLEQAAHDLGATPWVTFWKVTLPLIFPGILAGALLAFALSIDDFVTSNFVSGQHDDVPALGLRRGEGGDPAAGLRVREPRSSWLASILASSTLVFQGRKRVTNAGGGRVSDSWWILVNVFTSGSPSVL